MEKIDSISIAIFPFNIFPISCSQVSLDGNLLVLANLSGVISLWDLKNKQIIKQINTRSNITKMKLNHDSTLLVVFDKFESEIIVWDLINLQIINKISIKDDNINFLEISFDSEYIISGGNTIKKWNVKTGKLLDTIHVQNPINNMQSIPKSSQLIFTEQRDKGINILDITTMKLIMVLTGIISSPKIVKVNNNGELILSYNANEPIKIWNNKGEMVKTIKNSFGNVNFLDFNDNSTLIIQNENLNVFDYSTSVIIKSIQGLNSKETLNVPNSSDVILLNESINIVNLENGNKVEINTNQPLYDISSVIFSRLDNLLAFLSRKFNSLFIWRQKMSDIYETQILLRGYPSSTMTYNQTKKELMFNVDNDIYLVNAGEGKVSLVTNSQKKINSFLFDNINSIIYCLTTDGIYIFHTITQDKNEIKNRNYVIGELAHNTEFLAAVGEDNIIDIWDLPNYKLIYKLGEGHFGLIHDLSVSRDGNYLISGGKDGTIRIWKLPYGKLIKTIYVSESDKRYPRNMDKRHLARIFRVYHVDISKNGKVAYSSGFSEIISIWDNTTGNLITELKGHTEKITCLKISSDGKFCISGSQDKTVRVWDLETNTTIYILEKQKNWINSISFNNDETKFIVYSDNVSIWDLKTGELEQKIKVRPKDVLRAIELSPDMKTLVAAGLNNEVSVIDVKTNKTKKIKDHLNWVSSIKFTHDSLKFITGSYDGTIRVYETKTLKLIALLNEIDQPSDEIGNISNKSTDSVETMVVDPNDDFLYSSHGSVIKIWDLKNNNLIKTIGERHTDKINRLKFENDDDFLFSYSKSKTLAWDLNSGNSAPFNQIINSRNFDDHQSVYLENGSIIFNFHIEDLSKSQNSMLWLLALLNRDDVWVEVKSKIYVQPKNMTKEEREFIHRLITT